MGTAATFMFHNLFSFLARSTYCLSFHFPLVLFSPLQGQWHSLFHQFSIPFLRWLELFKLRSSDRLNFKVTKIFLSFNSPTTQIISNEKLKLKYYKKLKCWTRKKTNNQKLIVKSGKKKQLLGKGLRGKMTRGYCFFTPVGSNCSIHYFDWWSNFCLLILCIYYSSCSYRIQRFIRLTLMSI